MRKSRNKGDYRNLVIGILLLIVGCQSYFLFFNQSHKKNPEIQKVAKVPDEPLKVTKKVPPKKPIAEQSVPPVVSKPKKNFSQVPPNKEEPVPFQGRIAIIIDDWGYSLESCRALQEIKSPVAVAILPGLKHSKQIATCAHTNKKDVMLHLPMEPHQMSETYPENYIIETSMSRKKIQAILEKSLESVPFVTGVNNHMGSKVTENERAMKIIYGELSKRDLFFVDSFVTSKSICSDLAKKIDVRFARRDIFLDNENNRAYIEQQFKELAREAKQKGRAIAIGHDRRLTLQIIKEQTDILEKQGFRIVSVKDLLK